MNISDFFKLNSLAFSRPCRFNVGDYVQLRSGKGPKLIVVDFETCNLVVVTAANPDKNKSSWVGRDVVISVEQLRHWPKD